MKLITYHNPDTPLGFGFCVLITLPGLAKPLPTPFLGDDKAEVEARATEFGAKAEAFQAKAARMEAEGKKRRGWPKKATPSETDVSEDEPPETI